MMTTLNFGKFKGWTVEDLAKSGQTGRDYLSWCADNLRNRDIAKACANASTQQINKNLAIKAVIQDAGLDYEEARRWVQGEIENQNEEDVELDTIAQAEEQLEQDLLVAGVEQEQINKVWKFRWEFLSLIENGTIKFSSEERKEKVVAAFKKFYS